MLYDRVKSVANFYVVQLFFGNCEESSATLNTGQSELHGTSMSTCLF